MIGVRPTISARLSAIPGTIGWTVTAQGISARVRPVHTVVIVKPPIAEAAAAAGVVRGEVNPKKYYIILLYYIKILKFSKFSDELKALLRNPKIEKDAKKKRFVSVVLCACLVFSVG